MPRKRELGFIFLLHWTLHANFTVSRFADTLLNFTDPAGKPLSNAVVDPQSGDVFAAGTNVLYHLSPDLELKRTVRTGPVEDADGCPAPPQPCNRERSLKDNENLLLKMIDFLGPPTKLLLCGNVYNQYVFLCIQ